MGRGRPGPAAVQDTGGSSAVSKCSAAARGYIQDRFLTLLVGRRRRRRAPLVHRGYYIRARAVDLCVQDFLMKTHSHPRTQILSLGAGFDSLYFRLKDKGLLHRSVVYEVDFPNVACQKASLIKRMEELLALLGDTAGEGSGAITFSGEDYKLLGVDLSELPELERALEEAELDNEIPTLFIAEVVLTYMETCRSDALIEWAAERFSQACFLLYEQMCPGDAFGQVMQQHFSQRNTALRSLPQYPDGRAQQRRFLAKGWTECSVMDMNEFFTCCTPEDEQQRVQALEPFDEYEEWHLKCSHYFVLTASKGMEPSWTPLLPSVTAPRCDGPVRMAGSVTAAACAPRSEIPGLRRYGHSSVLVKPKVILTTGGFGDERGRHCRLQDFHLLSKHSGCWKAGCVKKENPAESWDGRLYHTVSCLSNGLALVVGGRTSPSSTGLGMLWLMFTDTCSVWDTDDITVEFRNLQPAAEPTALRWRHSVTEITFKGEKYLFMYGGRSAVEPVLGDWCFLSIQELSCAVAVADVDKVSLGAFSGTEIPVEGPVPEGRHSHSACSWKGGVLIAGGLGAAEQPLGSVFFLREFGHGFQWQAVGTQPPLIPRYSHTAHVHDGKLLLVGGVWLHSSCVPGITVLDLMTGLCLDYTINTESLEWPLMLHNHSSVFLPDEKELVLIGGGGNCFSFGTHLNPEPVSLSLSSILTQSLTGTKQD